MLEAIIEISIDGGGYEVHNVQISGRDGSLQVEIIDAYYFEWIQVETQPGAVVELRAQRTREIVIANNTFTKMPTFYLIDSN